jgi:hypothetical protein
VHIIRVGQHQLSMLSGSQQFLMVGASLLLC